MAPMAVNAPPPQPASIRRRRRRVHVALAVCAVVLVVVGLVVAFSGNEESSLVWSDDFNGTGGAAATGWEPQSGHFGQYYNSLECMTDSPKNSSLDGAGHLDLTARKDPGAQCGSSTMDYTSARLVSKPMHRMNTGYIEVRAKMALGSGMWNALWLLGSNYPDVGWPRCGELDIAEVVAKTPKAVYATAHGPGKNKKAYSIGKRRPTTQDLSTSFHTYSMDWTNDRIRFAFDDWVYLTLTRQEVEQQGDWVFDHDFDVLLSLAVGGDWPGPPKDDATFPQTMSVDYVRVYSSPPKAA